MNRRLLGLVAVIALWGCQDEPIEWEAPVALPPTRSAVETHTTPMFAGACPGSVRDAASGPDAFAVWWSVRPDSNADLMVSHWTASTKWMAPVRVDTADNGHTGCHRPAPSIAVDGENVHVAYAMAAREGPGIFASHSMDRGAMFHTPVPIVYGDGPGHTAISARGNLVAIAYDDPNTTPVRIGLALSRTMAHSFEWRGLVSPGEMPAVQPAVAILGRRISVVWRREDSTSTQMAREGLIR